MPWRSSCSAPGPSTPHFALHRANAGAGYQEIVSAWMACLWPSSWLAPGPKRASPAALLTLLGQRMSVLGTGPRDARPAPRSRRRLLVVALPAPEEQRCASAAWPSCRGLDAGVGGRGRELPLPDTWTSAGALSRPQPYRRGRIDSDETPRFTMLERSVNSHSPCRRKRQQDEPGSRDRTRPLSRLHRRPRSPPCHARRCLWLAARGGGEEICGGP